MTMPQPLPQGGTSQPFRRPFAQPYGSTKVTDNYTLERSVSDISYTQLTNRDVPQESAYRIKTELTLIMRTEGGQV